MNGRRNVVQAEVPRPCVAVGFPGFGDTPSRQSNVAQQGCADASSQTDDRNQLTAHRATARGQPGPGSCLQHPEVGTREASGHLQARVQTGGPWRTRAICPLGRGDPQVPP